MPRLGQEIDVIIEIPQGSRNKYEYDHEAHFIRLDRVLHSSVHYPTDYGFIPNTLSNDGDPLDVLVVVYEPTFPGCHLPARPIGVLKMRDEKGEDEKILAVPVGEPRFDDIHDLDDLPPHQLREIENFFATYKLLEEKDTELLGWDHKRAARKLIDEALARYEETLRVGSES
ncbi:MAG: inorganic diphosphatase [Chloroflexi bacterium]|nr:inorganic diphosphatase [Chloroflexota bacterium]